MFFDHVVFPTARPITHDSVSVFFLQRVLSVKELLFSKAVSSIQFLLQKDTASFYLFGSFYQESNHVQRVTISLSMPLSWVTSSPALPLFLPSEEYISVLIQWGNSSFSAAGIIVTQTGIPCTIDLLCLFQIKPTRCTLLLSVFISTSLHVSCNYMPIIRRTYCIYATLCIFHCVWVVVWSATIDHTATHTLNIVTLCK